MLKIKVFKYRFSKIYYVKWHRTSLKVYFAILIMRTISLDYCNQRQN